MTASRNFCSDPNCINYPEPGGHTQCEAHIALTAARRERADLRAWVEGEIRELDHDRLWACGGHTANAKLDQIIALKKVLRRLTDPSPAAPADDAKPEADERIYPCRKCGTLRSKAEGGTTFTVCDKCWDAKPEAGRT